MGAMTISGSLNRKGSSLQFLVVDPEDLPVNFRGAPCNGVRPARADSSEMCLNTSQTWSEEGLLYPNKSQC